MDVMTRLNSLICAFTIGLLASACQPNSTGAPTDTAAGRSPIAPDLLAKSLPELAEELREGRIQMPSAKRGPLISGAQTESPWGRFTA